MSAPMILAESEVERIIRLSRNAEFARAYLEKGIRVPTFSEILAEYSGITDASALREKLCTRLQGMIGEPNAASIRRKVSVWFTGKTAPENRGQLVRIVFALDMSDEQAQNFLACAGGGCLHQRNPIELAYLYALRSAWATTRRATSSSASAISPSADRAKPRCWRTSSPKSAGKMNLWISSGSSG